jgi:hypothetical protein
MPERFALAAVSLHASTVRYEVYEKTGPWSPPVLEKDGSFNVDNRSFLQDKDSELGRLKDFVSRIAGVPRIAVAVVEVGHD